MKNTSIAFLTVASILSLPNAAWAGKSSVPVISHNDLDLDGNPINPHCPDGWVYITGSSTLCKPFNGKDPEVTNNQPTTNNTTNNTNNPTSNAQSTSNANSQSSSSNSLNLNQFAIHNTNNQYYEYSNGAKIPASQLNLSYINAGGSDVIQAGISIPLGVKKASILKDVERSKKLEAARFCMDLLTTGVKMSDERMQYFDCDGFTYPEVDLLPVPVDNSQELAEAKQAIKDALKEMKEMKRMNEALQLRIIQMQQVPAKGVLRG